MDNMELPENHIVPVMPRVKVARIDIWRNEVAALTVPAVPGLSPSSPASPDPPSTSASSPSRSSSSMLSWPHEESRTRRIWRRLSRRLTGRDSHGRGGDGSGDDGMTRTQMYRDDRMVQEANRAAKKQFLLGAADESSEGDARGGLKDKQERLERAARLLDQGVARDA